MCGLSISKAPLQASTSSSCARSGKPSRTRNSSSFHDPRRIFTLPARTERPEARQLVAAFRGRRYAEAAERAHQVERLALASLPRILAEPDADLFAVLLSDTQQKPFDIARVGTHPYHIQ